MLRHPSILVSWHARQMSVKYDVGIGGLPCVSLNDVNAIADKMVENKKRQKRRSRGWQVTLNEINRAKRNFEIIQMYLGLKLSNDNITKVETHSIKEIADNFEISTALVGMIVKKFRMSVNVHLNKYKNKEERIAKEKLYVSSLIDISYNLQEVR